jgi:hypothetical protein
MSLACQLDPPPQAAGVCRCTLRIHANSYRMAVPLVSQTHTDIYSHNIHPLLPPLRLHLVLMNTNS